MRHSNPTSNLSYYLPSPFPRSLFIRFLQKNKNTDQNKLGNLGAGILLDNVTIRTGRGVDSGATCSDCTAAAINPPPGVPSNTCASRPRPPPAPPAPAPHCSIVKILGKPPFASISCVSIWSAPRKLQLADAYCVSLLVCLCVCVLVQCCRRPAAPPPTAFLPGLPFDRLWCSWRLSPRHAGLGVQVASTIRTVDPSSKTSSHRHTTRPRTR